MNELTDRQAEILNFVRLNLRDKGAPPTRADIAQKFGFSSANAAERHLRALEAKGYIELVSGSARGIRLLGEADQALTLQFQLPLVGRIAAGTPITASENIEDHLTIDPELFRPKADFLCRIAGHSMKEAGILDNDIVGIHYQEDANNGDIIAAALHDRRTGDERITLKRYFHRGRKITLKSENSDGGYEPIEIDLATVDENSGETAPFRIAGIYAGLIRIPR